MQKKYIIALTIIVLCLIFLFVCYFSRNKQEIAIEPIEALKQKTTINFISSWGSYDSKSDRLKTVLKGISDKYPMVEIQNSSMSGEDFLFILKTDFASGNDPSIFGLWPGSDFRLLVDQNKVADLTEVLATDTQWYKQFKEETWDYVTVDNRIYGLPIEIIYEGLFINKDLFEDYNVKIPTNFDELLKAVEIFRENGIIPIAYSETPEGSYIYQNIVMKLGGKEDTENPFDEEGKIKSCYIEGMYYMKRLYEAGAFPNHLFTIDDQRRNDLFLHKRAAMIVQGSWFIGDKLLSSSDETVGIIPFPSIEGGKGNQSDIIYGCGNGIFHISQKAWDNPAQRETCLLLLKELTSQKTASLFAEESGFISNIHLPDELSRSTPMLLEGNRLVENASELVGPVDSFIDRGIWENIIIKQFPSVLKGTITPEAVYKEVYKAMEKMP